MKRIFTLLIILFLGSLTVMAANKKEQKKVELFWGGRVDVIATYDSHTTVSVRGVQYMMPTAPVFNSHGDDINAVGNLGFSVAPSRLHFGANFRRVMKAKGKAYVEIDFMGAGNTPINMPRIRHAYFSLDWKRQSLLVGQTSTLAHFDEIAPATVVFGGGYPFNTLSRPIQVRFTQKLAKNGGFDVALSMFGGANGIAQEQAMLPDLHARFRFGNPDVLSAGIGGGVTVLKPRNLTADSSYAHKMLPCWDVEGFIRYRFHKYTLTLFGVVGTNLSRFEQIGGYAPLLNDVRNGVQDFGYNGILGVSTFADIQSPTIKGWAFGLFAGFQKNLGTSQEVDLSKLVVGYAPRIDSYWRIQPRVTYTWKPLTFGLEYSYTQATWAKEMDSHYRPSVLLPNTSNNRVTLLARFTF